VIAEKCGVSDRMVAKHRAEIAPRIIETFDDRPRTVTRSGVTYTMNTANIGAKPAPTAAEPVSAPAPAEWAQTDIEDAAPTPQPPEAVSPCKGRARNGFDDAVVGSGRVRDRRDPGRRLMGRRQPWR
jgi:hypothetical protein